MRNSSTNEYIYNVKLQHTQLCLFLENFCTSFFHKYKKLILSMPQAVVKIYAKVSSKHDICITTVARISIVKN